MDRSRAKKDSINNFEFLIQATALILELLGCKANGYTKYSNFDFVILLMIL